MSLEDANGGNNTDDDDVEFALTQLNHLLQLDSNSNLNTDTTLDENAKLVLKRLLTGATEHAFHLYSKVIEDEEQITSRRPKEMPQLRTSSSKISRSSPRDVPSCNSLSSFSKKKSCGTHERKRLNLILNSHDQGNYRNLSAREKPKVSSILLRTASRTKDDQASSSSSSSYPQSGNAKEQLRRQILPLPALLELENPNAKTRKHVSCRRKTMVERRRRRTRTSVSPSYSSSYSSSPSCRTQRALSHKQANSSSPSSTLGDDRRKRSMRAGRRIMVDPSHIQEAQKRIGRLQRFKNKLGLVFYHHHHHHHHHHEADPNKALSRHNHSVWNYLQKMTHRTPTTGSKHKDGKRGGGMVDGLVRHVWHSNKTDKKRSHSRNSAVVVNKWHWWQKFYKRKGVVRQNSNHRKRGKVRLGFTAAKRPPHVPALKFN